MYICIHIYICTPAICTHQNHAYTHPCTHICKSKVKLEKRYIYTYILIFFTYPYLLCQYVSQGSSLIGLPVLLPLRFLGQIMARLFNIYLKLLDAVVILVLPRCTISNSVIKLAQIRSQTRTGLPYLALRNARVPGLTWPLWRQKASTMAM